MTVKKMPHRVQRWADPYPNEPSTAHTDDPDYHSTLHTYVRTAIVFFAIGLALAVIVHYLIR